MASKIEALCRQAIKTFSRKQKHLTTGNFEDNLKLLTNYASKITASDVCLEESLSTVRSSSKASVTYIRIFEDLDVSVGIFVLKPEASLPLHNHPQMQGILKVLVGRVDVQSYTPLETHSWDSYFFFCEKHPPVSVDLTSDVCTLDSQRQNLHEIKYVDGHYAAFLDILAPPYTDFPDEDGEERDCFYYQASDDQFLDGKHISKLTRIPTPDSYTCDSAVYLGPPVKI